MKFSNLFLPALAAATVSASTSQYCYRTSSTHFCTSFSTYTNQTTDAEDLYVAFSGSPGPDQDGWIGVGTGNNMAGSLMFIIWTDSGRTGVALSPRSTLAHVQPSFNYDLPETKILSTKAPATKNDPMEIVFVCYSCASWMNLDMNNQKQSWIWASNYFQVMPTTQPHETIAYHQLLGKYFVDMSSVPSMGTSESPHYPKVADEKNYGAWDDATGPPVEDPGSPAAVVRKARAKATASYWHATIMLLAFLVILPLANVGSLMGRNSELVRKAQMAGAALASLGVLIAAMWVGITPLAIHQVAGAIVISALLFHTCFITMRMAATEQRHKYQWVAEVITVMGIVNAGFGLSLAKAGFLSRAGYLGVAMIEAVLVCGVMTWKRLGGLQKQLDAEKRGAFVVIDEDDSDEDTVHGEEPKP